MKTAFGLDLAGFSSGTSALVELAETNSDELVATVREDSSWREETEGAAHLGDLRSRIHKEIAACMPLAVDVPLDLNPIVSLLPADDAAPNHCFDMAWQHTLRPIDYALQGLPPLADRLGAAVARWRALVPAPWRDWLGDSLFETYPKATLRLSRLPHDGYKRARCRWEGQWWEARRVEPKDKRTDWATDHPLATIATKLKLVAANGAEFSDDEIDAVLCSLAAFTSKFVPPRALSGDALKRRATTREVLGARTIHGTWDVPRGYALVDLSSPFWSSIRIQTNRPQGTHR